MTKDWQPTEWWDDDDPPSRGIMIHEEDVEKAWSDIGPKQRVRWKTQTFVKRGTVVDRNKRTMTVLFDSHTRPTVIPDAKWYFAEGKCGNLNEHLVCISTPAPAKATQLTLEGVAEGDALTPNEAAALLGTDPKNIRRMIRSGKLPAHREGGRWVIDRKDL